LMSVTSPRRVLRSRTLAAAAGLFVGLALMSGCSTSSSVDLSGERMVPSSKAREALRQTKATVAGLESVHIKGLMVVSGSAMTVDLSVAARAAGGTLEVNGGKAEVRVLGGRLYLKGDWAFWDALRKGAGEDFADSWIEVSKEFGPQSAGLLGLVPASTVLDKLAPTEASWTEVPGRKLDGTETVGLRRLQSGHGDTVYVAKGKPAYPIGIELAQGGLLTFSQWGKPVKAPAAPPEPVLDATEVTLRGLTTPSR
jgi:hypothetical protein